VTVDQLNINYDLVDRKKYFEIIDFFERNSLTIQNLNEDKDIETLTTKTQLLSDYGHALAKGGQSTKSIPVLKEAIRLQEKHPEFNENQNKVNGYQYLVFQLGQSLFYTKRIAASRKIFEKLINLDPTNESYKSWIIATTNHRRKGISSVTLIIFSVWALIAVAFRDIVPGQFDLLFKMAGLTLFVVWTTVDLLSYLVKRKYR
jgi:tetratricopeptide (TPR) repeat protein